MPTRHTACRLASLFAGLALAACSGSGGGGGNPGPITSGVQLTAVHQGKLVDVYGLKSVGGNTVIELFRTDVLIGLDIQDQRDVGSTRSDSEILFDFLSPNSDTLQPRLLITRDIGSEAFRAAFETLDRHLSLISPSQWGRDTSRAPYTVVPRNAALRLTFSGDLGVTDDDFYVRDGHGRIAGYKNSDAVQLLEVLGDPNDNQHSGDFRVISTRQVFRGNQIIVDPVLLGSEGLIYGARNTASGMPESPDQRGANIRLAIAREGVLAIPGIAEDRHGSLRGRNNGGFESVIRDFRSGNNLDNSPQIARGFIRDPQPPRLIGQMLMYLATVEPDTAETRLVTIFKDNIAHELDRGDELRIFDTTSATPVASLEILEDPADDLGKPDTRYVRALVRPVAGPGGEDVLEQLDPANLPGYPPAGPARDEFLRQRAPKVVLVAEYTYRRPKPGGDPNEPYYGDDPRYFLSFNPTPLPADGGKVIANEYVSPFAGAIVRFTKPIDMSTLIALDTVFFATRNVLDRSAIEAFIKDRKIDPASFNEHKFRTPHLIHSRIFDEDGSQTAIRVQPTLGFYLDEAMRKAAEEDKNKPFHERRYHYFLHLVGGPGGVADLSGNPIDFQAVPVPGLEIADKLVMEFSLETRYDQGSSRPRFDDNLVAYVVRRFASDDEDELPNPYLPTEVTPNGGLTPAAAYPHQDLFGPISYADGELVVRPTSRSTKIVDNANQLPPPPQTSALRWCPRRVSQDLFATPTAVTPFGAPIQNPLNPYGCRLQTVWREIDMSLSRTDPLDFNLDVEQMYWAPYTNNPISFDEFDRVSLFLGHSEYRPENCSTFFGIPAFPNSGLRSQFDLNYAHNQAPDRSIEFQPARHPAYVDKILPIHAKDAILDPTGANRFLPLPKFEDATKTTGLDNPYFVWRDERIAVQGGETVITPARIEPYPFILSPFLSGIGRRVTGPPGAPMFNTGGWHNGRGISLLNGTANDNITQGLVGPIALPLLADFWTYPDSPELPKSNPFIASGYNGWQVSIPVRASPLPNFRAYSAGRGGGSPAPLFPSSPGWKQARGGYTPNGGGTRSTDNTVYWIMADFLKRTAVVTSGYVEIANPHRMPTGGDPRLGPYQTQGRLPDFAYDFEPPLTTLPPGTSVVPEFSGASQLDQQSQYWPSRQQIDTDATNFPLDPLKAGDGWVRKWDDRNGRNWWTYQYNRTVTSYVPQLNTLMDVRFTDKFSGPRESFTPADVKYFNWRFIMKNNVAADPPVSPKIESFSVSYRFLKAR